MDRDKILAAMKAIKESRSGFSSHTPITAKQFGKSGIPGEGTSYDFVIQYVDGGNLKQFKTVVPALSSPDDLAKVFRSIVKKMRKEGMIGDSRDLHKGTISLHVTPKHK